jgi:ketosteroid isomerase-like protein
MDLQEQLKAVNATLSEALERGDVTATTALFTDDAVCITPNFPISRGHAALVKLLRSWVDIGSRVTRSYNVQAESMGDGAHMVWAVESDKLQDDGSVIIERDKLLQVFKRDESGAWKIHRMCIATDFSPTDTP